MPDPDVDELEAELRGRVDGEVRFDNGTRAAYSTDGSNFRQVPIAVVVPRTVDAGVATVAVCHEHRVPVVSRGGGTSLAGQGDQPRGHDRLGEVLQSAARCRSGATDLCGGAGHRPGRSQPRTGAL